MFLLRHDASRARCSRPGWTDNLPAADFLIIKPFAAKTVQMERQRSAYYGSNPGFANQSVYLIMLNEALLYDTHRV